ncbi:Small nuclear RNA activating complex (SNAPc), subunit SNAP43 [Phytophthora cactorum]|nr:Small nuclear RNA activating complex (SNAPc), subunit SNAP43 [Phytophthora cactorum]
METSMDLCPDSRGPRSRRNRARSTAAGSSASGSSRCGLGASLQHFAAAVSDDLDDLHARFLQEVGLVFIVTVKDVTNNELTFAAWKQLWADARMSAAFHVEFWESSPTKTHKTILQQRWTRSSVASKSTMLGDPKHKIDVDPQAWTALLTVNFVVCGAGASLFPTAAREVRSIIHRLVVEEKAFLRCLQGFGPSVRVRNRAVRGQTADKLKT